MYAERTLSLLAVLLLAVPAWADDADGPVLGRCLKQLRSSRQVERLEGTACLSALARDNKEARRALIRLLKDRDPEVRAGAASEFTILGPAAEDAVPALIEALADEDGSVVEWATKGLGQIGPAAVPALEAALPTHHAAAARALGAIGPPALPALIRAIENPKLRGPATAGIEVMGPQAAPALPALVEGLKDPTRGMRYRVLSAMRTLGRRATPAVPVLIGILDDPDQDVRVGAAVVLAAIGPEAAQAVPKLWEMSRDERLDRQTRMNAELALKKIQGR